MPVMLVCLACTQCRCRLQVDTPKGSDGIRTLDNNVFLLSIPPGMTEEFVREYYETQLAPQNKQAEKNQLPAVLALLFLKNGYGAFIGQGVVSLRTPSLQGRVATMPPPTWNHMRPRVEQGGRLHRGPPQTEIHIRGLPPGTKVWLLVLQPRHIRQEGCRRCDEFSVPLLDFWSNLNSDSHHTRQKVWLVFPFRCCHKCPCCWAWQASLSIPSEWPLIRKRMHQTMGCGQVHSRDVGDCLPPRCHPGTCTRCIAACTSNPQDRLSVVPHVRGVGTESC